LGRRTVSAPGPGALEPLTSERPLIVYLDFKSPYAYLAWQPTRQIACELGIAVDWRPFVLDIPSYLGSARLDAAGRVAEQRRSAEQWSGVKYAYFDCRRYANLRNLTVRGTVKIWNTDLAAVGMLWARGQGDAVLERYVDGVYPPFWRRELDVEDPAVIRRLLIDAGADLAGFDAYASGAGAVANQALQQAAFDAGIFGVPTFVAAGERYFGREHLPRLRWLLSGESGPAPDVAYEVPDAAGLAAAHDLTVAFDFRSPNSYLAIAPTCAMTQRLGVPVGWRAVRLPVLKRPVAAGPDDDRGSRHRSYRAEYLAHDLGRYASHPLPDLYRDFDGLPAAMGLVWVEAEAPGKLDAFVVGVFERYWRDGKEIDSIDAVGAVLRQVGVDASDFAAFAAGTGPGLVEAMEDSLRAAGVIGTPTYLLDGEPYQGRQHLPLIEARLRAGGAGPH
jgi:2-hydroxychromene-2-carboxylate isomerase